jgi:salicylate hydroxylase
MTPIRVGVVGGGVAGPVLAIFLKLKGYEPVVFERQKGFTDRGVGIG